MEMPIPLDEVSQPLLDRHPWAVSGQRVQFGYVRPRGGHVARLHGQHDLLGLAAEKLLQQLDHPQQAYRAAVADVEDSKMGVVMPLIALNAAGPKHHKHYIVAHDDV